MPRIIFEKLKVNEQEQILAGETVIDATMPPSLAITPSEPLKIEGDGCISDPTGKSTGTITCLLNGTGQGGGGIEMK